ncbi:hypothetical protein GP486_004461 [Trichoglossum hirsutum]|uniref:Pentatricopeptide repeat protein n=1 Tax=Trichoglossum hirsutum TaxID=265104 RepID=A0A9P8LAY0_9PEZI|nr:hypothetical protein GP486_004461 [Trichoglossum hirsutum]
MPVRVSPGRFPRIKRFICPFLAPRVFTPWPKYRRLSGAAQEVPKDLECSKWRPMALNLPAAATSTPVEPSKPSGSKTTEINEVYRERLSSYRLRATGIASKSYPETVELKGFSSFWTLPFAALEAKYDTRQVLPRGVEYKLDPEVENWIQELNMLTSRPEGHSSMILKTWATYPAESKHYRWSQVMLWTLRHAPRHALRFLRETHVDIRPPSYSITDSLDYVACSYLLDVKHPEQRFLRELYDTVLLLLKSRPQTLPIRQRTIYLLLRHIGIEEATKLQDVLLDHSVPMTHHTFLHFIKKFATNRQLGRVWTLLDYLAESGIDLSAKPVMSMWSTLLRCSKAEHDSGRVHSALLQRMTDCGVRPNVINYSIIIENALETQGWEAGWRAFEAMRDDQVVPNGYTYAILFKSAKVNGDVAAMSHILDLARAEGHLLENAHLATDLLHAIFKSTRGVRRYRHLVDVYKQYFDVEPLKNLRIAHQRLTQDDPDTVMQPTPVTLGLMVMAYLDIIRNNPDSTPKLYAHYRKLVREGNHPLVTKLAGTPHVQDAFLFALGNHPATLHLCASVIEDMLQPLPYPSRIKPARPTVQTWSILVRSYMRHNQPAAAERVIQMMERHGMRPNEVTWNTLVSGYAGLQDVGKVVEVTDRMRERGWDGDGRTLEGLGRVINREKLVEALKGREEQEALSVPPAPPRSDIQNSM